MAVFVIFLLTKSNKRLYALRALNDYWIPDRVGDDKSVEFVDPSLSWDDYPFTAGKYFGV